MWQFCTTLETPHTLRADHRDVVERLVLPRVQFDRDVWASFGYDPCAARRQAAVDLPRCEVRIEGRRCVRLPTWLADAWVPYVTQAVMGLAVASLHQSGTCVLEPVRSSPLVVCAVPSSNEVVAHKRLRTWPADASIVTTVHVDGDHVEISYVHDGPTR